MTQVLSGCTVRATIQQEVAAGTIISADGKYRYALRRELGALLDRRFKSRRILWVMLNPSTADAYIDDPTITRCINYSKAWGFNTMDVGNLYGFRSTDPAALLGMAEAASVGAENDAHLSRLAFKADMILCAWGTKASHRRAVRVMSMLRLNGPLYALRITANGSPGHPLYLPKDLAPIPYSQSDTEVKP